MYREDRAIGEAAATTDPGGGAAVFNAEDVYFDTMRTWLSARLPTRLGLTPSTFTRSDRVEPTEIRTHLVRIPVSGFFTRPIQEKPKCTAPRPENLSAALRLAAECLRKVVADPDYKLDMMVWHAEQSDGKIAACLAGAVMAKHFNAPKIGDNLGPRYFEPWAISFFHALNELHRGNDLPVRAMFDEGLKSPYAERPRLTMEPSDAQALAFADYLDAYAEKELRAA
jgi:hypothetical protein